MQTDILIIGGGGFIYIVVKDLIKYLLDEIEIDTKMDRDFLWGEYFWLAFCWLLFGFLAFIPLMIILCAMILISFFFA